MMFLVVRRRNHGVALNKEGLGRVKPMRGVLLIDSQHVETLARASVVARIDTPYHATGTPPPLLYDVTIQGMAQNGFVLSGIEQIEQCFYAQSWWCRFEEPSSAAVPGM